MSDYVLQHIVTHLGIGPFVESTINQVVSRRFVKKQQMGWTLRKAQLVLQTRTKVLDGELDEVFRRWYRRFRPRPQTTAKERDGGLTPGFLLLSRTG